MGVTAAGTEVEKELSRGFPCDMSSIRERRDERGRSAILYLQPAIGRRKIDRSIADVPWLEACTPIYLFRF
jgi:hypothetical protein